MPWRVFFAKARHRQRMLLGLHIDDGHGNTAWSNASAE